MIKLCIWCTILALFLPVLVVAQEPDDAAAPPPTGVDDFLKAVCAADAKVAEKPVQCYNSILGIDNEYNKDGSLRSPRISYINWYGIGSKTGSINICMGPVDKPMQADCANQTKPSAKLAMLVFGNVDIGIGDPKVANKYNPVPRINLTLYMTPPFGPLGTTFVSVQIGTLYDEYTKKVTILNQKNDYGPGLTDFTTTMYRYKSKERTFIFVHLPPGSDMTCPPTCPGSDLSNYENTADPPMD
jgi:hypothetical protein